MDCFHRTGVTQLPRLGQFSKGYGHLKARIHNHTKLLFAGTTEEEKRNR